MNQSDYRAVLKLLPVFAVVAEVGQVTTAAAVLQMPQPTVSRALARLGELLGAPVIRREGRGIALTPAGRLLAPYAIEGLRRFDEGIDALTRSSQVGHGTLALAFQTLLGETVVPALISRFRERFPGVGYQLTQGARQRCLDLFAAGTCHVAVVASPPELPDTVRVVFYDEPLVLVVARTHPLAERNCVTLEDIAAEEMIVLKPGYGLRGRVDEIYHGSGIAPRVAFEAEDVHTSRGLVSAGLGVAILPAVADDARVEQLRLDHPAARRTIGAVVRDSTHDPTVGAFADFLVRWGRPVALAAHGRTGAG